MTYEANITIYSSIEVFTRNGSQVYLYLVSSSHSNVLRYMHLMKPKTRTRVSRLAPDNDSLRSFGSSTRFTFVFRLYRGCVPRRLQSIISTTLVNCAKRTFNSQKQLSPHCMRLLRFPYIFYNPTL